MMRKFDMQNRVVERNTFTEQTIAYIEDQDIIDTLEAEIVKFSDINIDKKKENNERKRKLENVNENVKHSKIKIVPSNNKDNTDNENVDTVDVNGDDKTDGEIEKMVDDDENDTIFNINGNTCDEDELESEIQTKISAFGASGTDRQDETIESLMDMSEEEDELAQKSS
ncbi:unnamed protein product [Mytilus coruscus]|uniref:Uncharacterized protein n=1 Tax=Mytilus coruscus TaxID=42192 RepID=A0A6J8D720_MYTCO|nr:unnamed protein product [Mytilus coruscus]